jgi:carbonic anhydrase
MGSLDALFANNRAWAKAMTDADPRFFERLSHQQAPQYLWIGCSDSRVPANQIVGLAPGELFVQRNVANLAVHTDFNLLSVLQFAVDVLRVSHVIVCGHYGCGGVGAVARGERVGLADNWLRHVMDVRDRHAAALATIGDETKRIDRLCELNVIEQAWNVSQTSIVLDAWKRGQDLSVHAWIYALDDGLLRNLGATITSADEARPAYAAALAALGSRP